MSIEGKNVYLDDDYEDSDSFLSEVPVNLLKESLINQFNSPSKYNSVDVVKAFIQNYKYTKAQAEEDEVEYDLVDAEKTRSEFIGFLVMLFKERFGIGMPNIGDASEDDQDELLHFTYRFFIINIKKNFVSVLFNYVVNHADELKNIGGRAKDISTIAYKKELDEPYIQIISNLGDIISHIFEVIKNEFTVDEFLNYCDMTIPCLETQLVSSAFDEDRLTGNFIEKYMDAVSKTLRFDIEVKVRNLLFNQFRKRKDGNDNAVSEEEN